MRKRITFGTVTPIILRVRLLRRRRGWSQNELARRAGIAQPTISRLEAGKTAGVDLATLEKLAKALRVRPRTLIG